MSLLGSRGNMLVFDNGAHHPIVPRSRVIEVDMNTGKIVWQYYPKHVFSLFSGHIAGADRLWNGNTLICEGQSGRVFEVSPGGTSAGNGSAPFYCRSKGCSAPCFFELIATITKVLRSKAAP